MSGQYQFIEALSFTASLSEYFFNDEEYSNLQSGISEQPDKGTVIPGAAPIRKLRWADKRRGMGRRGGLRVIYVHLPDLQIVVMLAVYDKDESSDLAKDEKKILQAEAKEMIEDLRAKHSRTRQ